MIFAFLAAALGPEHADLVSYFDRMRNKRNQAVYGMAGRIAETEARNLLTKATEFLKLVTRDDATLVTLRRPPRK